MNINAVAGMAAIPLVSRIGGPVLGRSDSVSGAVTHGHSRHPWRLYVALEEAVLIPIPAIQREASTRLHGLTEMDRVDALFEQRAGS